MAFGEGRSDVAVGKGFVKYERGGKSHDHHSSRNTIFSQTTTENTAYKMLFLSIILFFLAAAGVVISQMVCPAVETYIVETFGNLLERVERVEDSSTRLEKDFRGVAGSLEQISKKLDPVMPAWLQQTLAWLSLLLWCLSKLTVTLGAVFQVIAKWAKKPENRTRSRFTRAVVRLDRWASHFKINPTNEQLLSRAVGAELELELMTVDGDGAATQRDEFERQINETNQRLGEAIGQRDNTIAQLNIFTNQREEERGSALQREREMSSELEETKKKLKETEDELEETKKKLKEAEAKLEESGTQQAVAANVEEGGDKEVSDE